MHTIIIPLILSNTSVSLISVYEDPEETEDYYALGCGTTSVEEDDPDPLMVFGGKTGSIKVVNIVTRKCFSLPGHAGMDIYAFKGHTINHELMFSASKDEAVRLWNLREKVLIAIFAADNPNRFSVLTVDVHADGLTMTSAGHDSIIRVWNLYAPNVVDAIDRSFNAPRPGNGKPFEHAYISEPIYSTGSVHQGLMVDCVRYLSENAMITKSIDNSIKVWTPDAERYPVRTYIHFLVVLFSYLPFTGRVLLITLCLL